MRDLERKKLTRNQDAEIMTPAVVKHQHVTRMQS